MIDKNQLQSYNVQSNDWSKAKCDRYDYLAAAFCGGAAGLIDVFFVGDPITSVLGKYTDKAADNFVQKAAQLFWKNDTRKTGKFKKMPQDLEKSISYLEQAFPVKYDARYAKDLVAEEGVLKGMKSKNHHLLSLEHSPDMIGLTFAIINQFRGKATFIDKGEIIHLVPKKTSGAVPYLQGTTLPSMIFSGFINWIGHIISDMVGSSSTREEGKTGRGAGIPIPFFELLLLCDSGNFKGETFAQNMIKVFEEGYDLRFGAAMSIPVILNELMIKVFWIIRNKFIRKKSWNECFPSKKHADLRIMLIVGNSTLCLIDGADAALHSVTGGNLVVFVCHLNLIGWARLVMLVLREMRIRFGSSINNVINDFVDSMLADIRTSKEREQIEAFYKRLDLYDMELSALLAEFVAEVEKEYKKLYIEIDSTFDEDKSIGDRAEHSIKLAQVSGVEESRIVKNREELDDLFS